jgi:hypothetical protein
MVHVASFEPTGTGNSSNSTERLYPIHPGTTVEQCVIVEAKRYPSTTDDRRHGLAHAVHYDPDPASLGWWLDDLARLVMQFVVVMFICESALHKRVFSDALLIGIFIVAFGWWLSIRAMRQEARRQLMPDAD